MKLFCSKYRLALCCSLTDALISLLKSLFSTAFSASACEIVQNIGMIRDFREDTGYFVTNDFMP